MAPLLTQVQSVYLERAAVEEHLLVLLNQLCTRADYAQGYGPANLLALLREQRGHLRGLNLSQIVIRGRLCKGSRCRIRSFREPLCVRRSGLPPSMPSGRWLQTSTDSTGLRAAGRGKCGRGKSGRRDSNPRQPACAASPPPLPPRASAR